jgi:hypothetical protein
MGWIRRIFGGEKTKNSGFGTAERKLRPVGRLKPRKFIRSRDYFDVKVVGTSHYQDAIKTESGDADNRQFTVHVLREPDNPSDPGAVRIATPDGQTIGYLPKRGGSRLVGPAIDVAAAQGIVIACDAQAYGGDRSTPTIGVGINLEKYADLKKRFGD